MVARSRCNAIHPACFAGGLHLDFEVPDINHEQSRFIRTQLPSTCRLGQGPAVGKRRTNPSR